MNRLARKAGEKPSLWKRIKDVAFTDVGVLVRGLDVGSLGQIEELLLAADFGVPATLQLVDHVEQVSRAGHIQTEQEFLRTVQESVHSILTRGNSDTKLHFANEGVSVFLIVGVNGVGKTTTIGKLAHRLKRRGHRPMLAAADTFRAGAIDQLRLWAERVGVEFVGAKPGADPAAVAFDAIDAAAARGSDIVLIDTAGRLHTQGDLMQELSKVERVVARRATGGPHETLLVLDATVGQNAVAQAKTFHEALHLSGLILAKLDSTARGGIVVALKQQFDIPVKLVGTGEAVSDLEEFDPQKFARDVLLG